MKKTKKCCDKNLKLNESQKMLVEKNIKLAYSRANKMQMKYNSYKLSIDSDDFESYALEGLCDAALRFDSSYNVKFSTFAVSYIDNYIKTYVLAENPTIKLPTYSADAEKMQLYRYLALENALICYVDNEKQDCEGNLITIDHFYSKGIDDTGFKDVEEHIYLEYISNQLSELDKQILKGLVIDDISSCDIAKQMNIHINTVSRRKKKISNNIINKIQTYN